jgi:hypothetical protein
MTITQVADGVVNLVAAAGETNIYDPVMAGGAVLLLNLTDMTGTDELRIRHYVNFPVDGNTIVGSFIIEHGVTTDPQWATGTTAGGTDAEGWTSWPLGFADPGGTITLEALTGTFDIEYVVLSLGGPTG